MSFPSTPSEAAPAYSDAWNDHPVSQDVPLKSHSSYIRVPQDELEDQAESQYHTRSANHICHTSSHGTTAQGGPSTPPPDLEAQRAGEGHVHCAECDKIMMRREAREASRHACSMVAAVFIIGFFFLFATVAVVLSFIVRMKKRS